MLFAGEENYKMEECAIDYDLNFYNVAQLEGVMYDRMKLLFD